MSFFDSILKRKDEVDIEEFLNKLDEEDDLYEDADAFVKPIFLKSDEDINLILKEAKAGNIVLLDIDTMHKRNRLQLKNIVNKIKNEIQNIDSEIARISEEKVLITPHRVKIYKKKRLVR